MIINITKTFRKAPGSSIKLSTSLLLITICLFIILNTLYCIVYKYLFSFIYFLFCLQTNCFKDNVYVFVELVKRILLETVMQSQRVSPGMFQALGPTRMYSDCLLKRVIISVFLSFFFQLYYTIDLRLWHCPNLTKRVREEDAQNRSARSRSASSSSCSSGLAMLYAWNWTTYPGKSF